jgi:hypothetical protein
MNPANNDKKYTITIDPTPQHKKPDSRTVKNITRNLSLVTGVTINEFSELVSPPNSFTWSGGIFEGSRSNNNWRYQSVFALDFDKGTLSIQQIINRIQQFDIHPQIWYSSFSDSSELRKFRVVLFLDSPVDDPDIYKLITSSLKKLYPEADNCFDPARFFYGGKQSTIIHTQPISNSRLIDALSIQMMTSDSNSTRKLPLSSSYYSRVKTAGIGESYKRFYPECYFSAEKENSGIISSLDQNFQKYTSLNGFSSIPSIEDQQIQKHTSLNAKNKIHLDFDLARETVKILDEFLKGTWLYHMELFGLATNLVHVRGGFQLMKKTMDKYNQLGITHYTKNNYNILPYVSKVEYHPIPIHRFSPYEQDMDLFDIVSSTKDVRGRIDILEPIHKIELEEAEKTMESTIQKIIEDGEKGKIYLIKLPTAIGKTQIITSLVGVTISVPTNRLKNEISERMKVKYMTTPDPVIFDDISLNSMIEYYFRLGLPRKVSSLLYNVSNRKGITRYSEKDVQRAEEYLNQLRLCQITTDTLITTHSRSMINGFQHDTLIFDEDPINQVIDIKQLKISDLHKINIQSSHILKDDLDPVIQFLLECNPMEPKEAPKSSVDLDKLVEQISRRKIDSNVIEFFDSDYLMKDKFDLNKIHYVVERKIPDHKKVIILSATIPVNVYQRIYGDRVEVIDLMDVKQQGTIVQHTSRSCSRDGLNRYASSISKEIGDKPVITFMKYRHHFQNPVQDMYFGNCSGYDGLKGIDLAVVGTPHRNNVEYVLMSKVMGIDFTTEDLTMTHQPIEYAGFRFKFNCFNHPDLRGIQLSLIESDLIQAVGRARTLRTDARVEVYSNFPLRISDQFVY